MNITFTEIINLDEPAEEINQNPYFNEKVANNKTRKTQKIKSILRKPKDMVQKYELLEKSIPQYHDEQPQPYQQEEPYDSLDQQNHLPEAVKPTKPMQQKKPKKKGISYDDILSSMNTVVIDGKLEFIRNDSQMHKHNSHFHQEEPEPQLNTNQSPKKIVNYTQTQRQQQHQQQHQQQYPQQHQQQHQQQPGPIQNLDPNVKNSYIFNKYFKDYKDPEYHPIPKNPLTKQQLFRQLLIDQVNRYNNSLRISQIKSTRLLFNSNNNNIIRNAPLYNRNNGNHLFKFKS